MARLTNAQLAAQLEAAHVKYEALAAKYEALKAEHRTAVDMVERHTRPASAPTTTRVMRDGRAYDKVQVGWNRYVYREVQ